MPTYTHAHARTHTAHIYIHTSVHCPDHNAARHLGTLSGRTRAAGPLVHRVRVPPHVRAGRHPTRRRVQRKAGAIAPVSHPLLARVRNLGARRPQPSTGTRLLTYPSHPSARRGNDSSLVQGWSTEPPVDLAAKPPRVPARRCTRLISHRGSYITRRTVLWRLDRCDGSLPPAPKLHPAPGATRPTQGSPASSDYFYRGSASDTVPGFIAVSPHVPWSPTAAPHTPGSHTAPPLPAGSSSVASALHSHCRRRSATALAPDGWLNLVLCGLMGAFAARA
jgi:hypothetical protein